MAFRDCRNITTGRFQSVRAEGGDSEHGNVRYHPRLADFHRPAGAGYRVADRISGNCPCSSEDDAALNPVCRGPDFVRPAILKWLIQGRLSCPSEAVLLECAAGRNTDGESMH